MTRGVIAVVLRSIQRTLGGGGGDVYVPKLDFSDSRNSQYMAVFLEEWF